MVRKVVPFKRDNKRNEGGSKMGATIKMKPIQATPELKGKDAMRLIEDVFARPSEQAIQSNRNLLSILKKIER